MALPGPFTVPFRDLLGVFSGDPDRVAVPVSPCCVLFPTVLHTFVTTWNHGKVT